MSTADGWDFTVPDDEAELLAELRRHVVPGKRYRLVETPEPRLTDAPRRSLHGALAGRAHSPSWEDFEAASEAATADAEGRYQDGGPWDLGR